MLLDNENKKLKVHQWISKYSCEGKFDIVTGYFTVGALAFLARETNKKVNNYRFMLGDIVSTGNLKERALDLLNENISINAALKLSQVAKEAVNFLEQDKVLAKTLEPNFCHAKAYLFTCADADDPRNNFFITGSSNLTDAGIGKKTTHNVELNIADFGSAPQYRELIEWFEELWNRPQAHTQKTLYSEDGKRFKKPFKQYLIDEIKKIFVEYTPRQLYYKVLFELFGDRLLKEESDPELNRQVGRLENTAIYQTLYEFQQKGVLSLIKMLQRYDGAILADAVGLGKTWSALAIMKFYQLQGREVVLLCPKKLYHNWHQYQRRQDSRFEKDSFDYHIRFHTDLHADRLASYTDRADKCFVNEKPKLFVIDESHNLRNDKSQRYQFLLEEIIKKNEDVKVLMLSATPINNTLLDIRNQFKLIAKGDNRGFQEPLGVRNLEGTFRRAQTAFNEWSELPNPTISDFISRLQSNFFTLTDSLVVARTRKMIEGWQDGLTFPRKAKPENIFVTPNQFGNIEDFAELENYFPPRLSGYQPARYVKQADDVDILHDEQRRDFFLVRMMYILLVKRLESSWYSFMSTAQTILNHHQNALDKIKAYQEDKENADINDATQLALFANDELEEEAEEYTLGKKRKISIADIDASGNLDAFKKDLKKDIDALRSLQSNLASFAEEIKQEEQPGNVKSKDTKLEKLIAKIAEKRAADINRQNPKVIIFTVYKDTAQYLFKQLHARGLERLALVSGDESRTSDSDHATKKFEPILERFAPFTKLFREKEWDFVSSAASLWKQYQEWQTWIAQHDPATHQKLQSPVDILIATDVLSEGQNLQDCDMVINYDIHWNPVRVIQRMGRIDRLGSPNEVIFGVNFWPSATINSYLNLQGRIEKRMTAMKLAGSEVDQHFTETFRVMSEDDRLEQKLKDRMLEQMQASWDDIEVSEQSLGFDNLSLETYRQELDAELKKDADYYQQMPRGVYTGFRAVDAACPEPGLIALLGYPARLPKATDHRYQAYELIYVDHDGKAVRTNQREILDALTAHKDEARHVPTEVDQGDEATIRGLSEAIATWLKAQAVEEEVQEDGSVKTTIGSSTKDLLNKLKSGDKAAFDQVKAGTVEERYRYDNFDLLVWFIVNP